MLRKTVAVRLRQVDPGACAGRSQRPEDGEAHLRGNRIDRLGENQLSLLRRSASGFVFQSGQLLSEPTAEENAPCH